MSCRRFTALLLAASIVLTASASNAQQTGAGEADRWRAVVERLEPAAFVRVRLRDGSTRKGTVLAADQDTFSFKPRTRIPVAALDVPYAEVVALERTRQGMSPGQKVLAGTAGVVAGALLAFALVVVAAFD